MTRKKNIEPLLNAPDYVKQRHESKFNKQANVPLRRIYFVDKNYNNLFVYSTGVDIGEFPIIFKGKLEELPRVGDVFMLEDKSYKFKVIAVERVLYKSFNVPEKVFVVLEAL